MHSINLAYPLFALLLVALCLLAFFLCLFIAKFQVLRRENRTLSAAYSELTKGAQRREADLLSERNLWSARAAVAEADADRLAPLVAAFVKIVEETAGLLRDENPPALTPERQALAGHQTALVFRTNEIQIPLDRSHEKADAARAVCADAAPRR